MRGFIDLFVWDLIFVGTYMSWWMYMCEGVCAHKCGGQNSTGDIISSNCLLWCLRQGLAELEVVGYV